MCLTPRHLNTSLTFVQFDYFIFISDVNTWLVTFGFHLHNTIPGFPAPKFDINNPSYELMKSQFWDDLPVSISLCGLNFDHFLGLECLDRYYMSTSQTMKVHVREYKYTFLKTILRPYQRENVIR